MISNSLRNESPVFKICICGQQGVGKTAILNYRTSGVFNPDYHPTIAAAFATVSERVDNKTISLNVWDTAGQEKYQNMMPLYFRNVNCVILVLDVTATSSWEFVKRWVDFDLPEIKSRPILFLCLNKKDLSAIVDIEKIENWADERVIRVVKTSASTGENVGELFREIARALCNTTKTIAQSQNELMNRSGESRKCC